MSIPLPPLPPTRSGWVADDHHMTWYDVDQLRARDLEVARVALEAAANQAENTICSCCYSDGSDAVAEDISAAIRALEFKHG